MMPHPAVLDACAIGFGAVAGALSRHQVGKLAASQIAKDPARLGPTFERWHTAGINVAGSFILGVVSAVPTLDTSPKQATAKFGCTSRQKLLLGIGFCGSFTTFSTYSVDVIAMLNNGQSIKAIQYICVNNMGGIAAAALGMMLVRRMFGK